MHGNNQPEVLESSYLWGRDSQVVFLVPVTFEFLS